MTKVNAENIRKVISMIEKEQNHFDMDYWSVTDDFGNLGAVCLENVCGTPSCIGGWAEAIMMRELGYAKDTKLHHLGMSEVGAWLGLNYKDADDLFYPYLDGEDGASRGYTATREQAINHLNHIIETGEVNWEKFV